MAKTKTDVWLVHGNWVGNNKHSVYTQVKGKLQSKQFKNLSQAKLYASIQAKKNKLKNYDMENASGKWKTVKSNSAYNKVKKKLVIKQEDYVKSNNPWTLNDILRM